MPAPKVGWEPVYELLCCIKQVTPDPDKRAEHSLTLVAGMQAGETIDEWLLVELMSMAGVDVEEEPDRSCAAAWISTLTGAGLLSVTWSRGSALRAPARDPATVAEGGRSRARHRDRLAARMRLVEDGLRKAMEVVEEAADEDG